MATVNALAKALNDVHLSNTIEECVITIEDNVASILAIDITESCFVSTSAEFEHEDTQFGIGNLSLFCKYMNTLKDVSVKFKQKDNVLTIKPKNGAVVKYIMADVDLIPSYKDEWEEEGDIIKNELDEYTGSFDLTLEKVSEFMNLMGMFDSSSVSFSVDKKGKITLHGGKETEHQIDVILGSSDIPESTTFVYNKHLGAVLNSIDFGAEPKLYLSEDEAVIITTNTSSWLLRPVSDD